MRRSYLLSFVTLIALAWTPLQRAASTQSPAAIASASVARVTLAPAGPFHVSGNQVLDSKGKVFVIRGTQVVPFHLDKVAYDNRAGLDYGALSATTLSAIRLRFNLNAVRLPLDLSERVRPGYFAALANVVRRANSMDLLVILATGDTQDRLPELAAYFKTYPNVMFETANADAVRAIRAAGAVQPVILNATTDTDDSNVIYESSPAYSNLRTNADRDHQFSSRARSMPVLATGLDPELADASACATIPSDPSAAAALIEANLDYFDTHSISWIISSFEPGKLIRDLSLHDATTLENGWTCGRPDSPPAGIGRIIQAHMRGSVERELFVVSGAGGMDIARGAFALAYGPVMATHDAQSLGPREPVKLGGISIQVTDARGVTRPAGIFWASEGWGQTNFTIPDGSAPGPARMTVVRDDGSQTRANITIADTAPGFVTGHSCRGPAIGTATFSLSGRTVTSDISSCKGFDCRTIAIPVATGATTRVQIRGSGFRHANSASSIEMRIAGVRVPVVSFGPVNSLGEDQVTIEIPSSLYGIGETDLICHLNGRISNATRIRIGKAKPVS